MDLSAAQRVAAAIGAVTIVCAPLTASFEGFVPKAKPDPAGILTGCNGEVVTLEPDSIDPSRIYSRSECMARLREKLARIYAPKIAACLPELVAAGRRNEFVAMLDTSYNSGPAAVCGSPMARHIHAHEWPAACASLKSFYVGSITKRPVKGAMDSRLITSGPHKGEYLNRFRGLIRRRAFFSAFCMKPESGDAAHA